MAYNYIEAGDIVFMQEYSMFDDYTKLNSQTCHQLKQSIRVKTKQFEGDQVDVTKQWGSIGIVIDSEVEEVKYILSITADGFEMREYMS